MFFILNGSVRPPSTFWSLCFLDRSNIFVHFEIGTNNSSTFLIISTWKIEQSDRVRRVEERARAWIRPPLRVNLTKANRAWSAGGGGGKSRVMRGDGEEDALNSSQTAYRSMSNMRCQSFLRAFCWSKRRFGRTTSRWSERRTKRIHLNGWQSCRCSEA